MANKIYYTFDCDLCSTTLDYRNPNLDRSRQAAQDAGWLVYGDTSVCSYCREDR